MPTPRTRKRSPLHAIQKSAGRSLSSLLPGKSLKKVSRSLHDGHRETVKDIGALKQDYTENFRWQVQHLFSTYRATLWRRIAVILAVITVAAVTGMTLMYFRFTPARPLVTIGNHVVHRSEYMAKVDEAAGRAVLTKIVYSELVRQAAAKTGAMPVPAQIDERITEMKRHGQEIPTGKALAEFRDNLALDLALENLRVAGVTVTDAELAQVYKNNKAQLTDPAQVQSILVVAPNIFASQTALTLLSKGKTAAEVAAVPDMHVDGENGYHVNLAALPPALHDKAVKTALNMQPGQITTLPVGTAFLVIKCLHKTPAYLPSLPEIKDKLMRAVQLQKAPSATEEMVKLYRANKPTFDMDRYGAYFSGIERAGQVAPTVPLKTPSAP